MNAIRPCERLMSGSVELYFYGELPPDEREAVERHVGACGACKHALDELSLIRAALSTRPIVSAPPDGDWRGFMAKLDDAVRLEDRRRDAAVVRLETPASATCRGWRRPQR
jgi:anti-sigma factor RsiW